MCSFAAKDGRSTSSASAGSIASKVRIPTKPAMHSNLKPATYSDAKPARDSDVMPATLGVVSSGLDG